MFNFFVLPKSYEGLKFQRPVIFSVKSFFYIKKTYKKKWNPVGIISFTKCFERYYYVAWCIPPFINVAQ